MAMSKPVILITGGGRRIGAATSKLLMESGYYVLIHVRNSVELANQLIEAHSNENKCEPCGEVIVADLASDEELNSMINTVKNNPMVKQAGGLFGLINNASIYTPIDFEELTLEIMRTNFRIHLEVPFILTKQLIQELTNASGSIVSIIDTSQGRAWEGLSHYTSSKSALRQLMINLAGDLHDKIRVNCVAPGAIISADWEAEHFASVLEKVPMGRSGKPIDIANSVKFLLESDHLSGQIINVDGGWTIVE